MGRDGMVAITELIIVESRRHITDAPPRMQTSFALTTAKSLMTYIFGN